MNFNDMVNVMMSLGNKFVNLFSAEQKGDYWTDSQSSSLFT